MTSRMGYDFKFRLGLFDVEIFPGVYFDHSIAYNSNGVKQTVVTRTVYLSRDVARPAPLG